MTSSRRLPAARAAQARPTAAIVRPAVIMFAGVDHPSPEIVPA